MTPLLLILVATAAAVQAAAAGRPPFPAAAQSTAAAAAAAAAGISKAPLPAAGGGATRYLRWPLSLAAAVASAAAPPPRRTWELCQAAAHGKAHTGDAAVYAALSRHLGLSAGTIGAHLPPAAGGRGAEAPVDVTTVETLAQLVTPGLRLVLDPLLYLEAADDSRSSAGGGGNGFMGSGGSSGTAGGAAAGGSGGLHAASGAGDTGDGGIPRVIHMTMRSKHKLQPHQVLSILSWGRQNVGYDLLLYDDADMERYIRRYHPGFLPTFNTLRTPVERSDAWRYHVLCGHGGIYADTDTVALAPFDTWVPRARASAAARRLDARRSRLAAAAAAAPPPPSREARAAPGAPPLPRPPSADAGALSSVGGLTSQRVWRLHAAAMGPGGRGPGLVVGVENVFGSQEEAEDATYASHIQMIQWTMAARRGHPLVCGMGGMIQERLANETADLLRSFRTAAGHNSGGGHVGGGTTPRAFPSGSGSGSGSVGGGSGVSNGGGEDPLPPLGHDAGVLLRTGPGIWSRAVHGYIRANGTTPEALVTGGWAGDVLILPQTALGCAARLWYEDNEESFVLHMYKNSWKQDHFRVADARKEARRALRRKRQLQRVGRGLLTAAAAVGTACLLAIAFFAPKGPLRQKRRRITRDE